MDKIILDKLEIGERIVEMQECIIRDKIVIKVTVYTCVHDTILLFLNSSKIEEYTFPFYFISKNFAEEFLQNYDKYEVVRSSYWGDDRYIGCYILNLSNNKNQLKYYMVDEFKNNNKNNYNEKCYLCKDGIWGGIVNISDGCRTYSHNNLNYTEIINRENIVQETDKKYIFKMVEQ